MIGSLIRLILLPIVIIRVFVWRIVWHSVYFFLKRPLRLLYLAAALLIGIVLMGVNTPKISGGGGSSTSVSAKHAPVPAASSAVGLDGHPPGSDVPTELPPIEGPIIDGNKSFTHSLLEKMQEDEIAFYSREFHTAMYYSPPNQPYLWQNKPHHMFGSITAKEPFQASGGSWCREFDEVLSYREEAHHLSGFSCKRKNQPGWCKLRPRSVKTCEVLRPHGMDGFFLGIKESLRNMF